MTPGPGIVGRRALSSLHHLCTQTRKTYSMFLNHYISDAFVKFQTTWKHFWSGNGLIRPFCESGGGVRIIFRVGFGYWWNQRKLVSKTSLSQNKWLHRKLYTYLLVDLSRWKMGEDNLSRRQMRKLLCDHLRDPFAWLRWGFLRSAELHTVTMHDGISRACMKKSFIPSPGKRHVKTAE